MNCTRRSSVCTRTPGLRHAGVRSSGRIRFERSADLRAIARKGHVYQGYPDFTTLDKTGGRIVPKLIGINEASTFWGFCEAHDCATFAPLETQVLLPTEEQAFLLAYRPLVKELYLKHRQRENNELLRQADMGKPIHFQLAHQDFINTNNMGIKSAIDDLRHHKEKYDAILASRCFDDVCYVAIHLDRAPDIMCSGFIQPAYTFDGVEIQDLADIDSVLQEMSFSLVATKAGGAAVFSWLAGSDAASGSLVDSLLSLPADEIPSALVRFALSELENCFMRPDWWESLDASTQEALTDRINMNANPFDDVNRDCLRDDGIRSVDWRVLSIDQKRS